MENKSIPRDLPLTPEQQELSDELDAKWRECMLGCLAVITAWQEREREHGTSER